ncbi:MAG: hypothetical protein L6V93_11995 [Clostridiales bacterium]|nr:MAG: hypothetical protein L6V93_11995 [Clostridiales bacterium]
MSDGISSLYVNGTVAISLSSAVNFKLNSVSVPKLDLTKLTYSEISPS